MGQLIAVLSGKGGTGKTSICAGLAEALSLSGERVLCIDCDVGLRNLDIALALSEEGALSFEDVYASGFCLDVATAHPVFPNLRFLTAPVGTTAGQVDLEAFENLLEQAREQFSYVLLDAPAGLDDGFTLATRYAEQIVLVTLADPAAIRDARRAGELLEQMGKENVRLIVNRVRKKRIAALRLTVDDIMDRTGLPLLGLVPEDPDVTMAANFQQPLLGYTLEGAAAACQRIAKRIRGYATPLGLK